MANKNEHPHDPTCECCIYGREAYLEKLAVMIERRGHAVIGTFTQGPGDSDISMAYTVGLAKKGLPEIVVFGVPREAAMPILNSAAALLIAGKLETDVPVSKLASMPLVFKHVAPEATEKYLTESTDNAGRPVAALQMVWPDTQGRFPWDPRFEQQLRAAQPLLFLSAPAHVFSLSDMPVDGLSPH